MTAVADHPLRVALTNELHARPFPVLGAPMRVSHYAIKRPERAAERDRALDVRHLALLCARFGAPPPAPDARHYAHDFGRFELKWEQHTEFVTYTVFAREAPEPPFSAPAAALLPAGIMAEAPGQAIAAVHIRIEAMKGGGDEAIPAHLRPYLAEESMAGSCVAGCASRVLGDFRIHEDGFTRFVVLIDDVIRPRQLGRVVLRLLEIETYRSMALLSLPVAQSLSHPLTAVDRELAETIGAIGAAADLGDERATLETLTRLSAEVEGLTAEHAFRLSASRAYAALVRERINALREDRIEGVQTLDEFMRRRFDPAMRTAESASARLEALSRRAGRAANLLRTRVDLAVEAQNQAILHSMNARAALQLRLQETVEGLSVVAISYYAVSLAGYLLAPFGAGAGLGDKTLKALVAVPIIAAVWWSVRRIRARAGHARQA